MMIEYNPQPPRETFRQEKANTLLCEYRETRDLLGRLESRRDDHAAWLREIPEYSEEEKVRSLEPLLEAELRAKSRLEYLKTSLEERGVTL